jgi:hypothetical protein
VLEKDGLPRGLSTTSSSSSSSSLHHDSVINSEIQELAKTSGLSRILWPRWGPLTQTARLHLLDCITSSTEKASINSLLDTDALSIIQRGNSLLEKDIVSSSDGKESGEISNSMKSEGFESYLSFNEEEEEDEEEEEEEKGEDGDDNDMKKKLKVGSNVLLIFEFREREKNRIV